jgi:hypothetical protein
MHTRSKKDTPKKTPRNQYSKPALNQSRPFWASFVDRSAKFGRSNETSRSFGEVLSPSSAENLNLEPALVVTRITWMILPQVCAMETFAIEVIEPVANVIHKGQRPLGLLRLNLRNLPRI